MTLMRAAGAHDWLTELSQQPLANALITGGSRFDVAREAGQRVQEIGTADDANQLLAAHHRQPFDPMLLHHSHDFLERRLFGDGDGIGGHDLVHLAPMGAGIFVRKPARPDQEFEPTRSPPLRSGFGAAKEIAFRHNADETSFLVDDRQSTDVPLQHYADRLQNRAVRFNGQNGRGHHILDVHGDAPFQAA